MNNTKHTPQYRATYRNFRPIELWTAKTPQEARTMAARLWDLKPSQEKNITIEEASCE